MESSLNTTSSDDLLKTVQGISTACYNAVLRHKRHCQIKRTIELSAIGIIASGYCLHYAYLRIEAVSRTPVHPPSLF